MQGESTPIIVIGIGNIYRCDDGIGIVLARALQEFHLPHVEVIEQSGEGAQLIETWRHRNAVILVDAVSSGSVPGTIFRLDATREKIPSKFFNYSTHAFSLAESIELSRIMDELPQHCIVFGIEGSEFGYGEMISAEVMNVFEIALKQIVNEIEIIST